MAFLLVYKFQRHLKLLKYKTPYQIITEIYHTKPHFFTQNQIEPEYTLTAPPNCPIIWDHLTPLDRHLSTGGRSERYSGCPDLHVHDPAETRRGGARLAKPIRLRYQARPLAVSGLQTGAPTLRDFSIDPRKRLGLFSWPFRNGKPVRRVAICGALTMP